jgi:hypothetical protein
MGGQQYAPGGAITFQDLKDLRYYSQIPDTVQAWDYLVQGIETSHSDLSNVQRQLPQNIWSGVAAQLAHDQVSTAKQGLQGSKAQIANIAVQLRGFYANLDILSDSLTAFLAYPHVWPTPVPPGFVAAIPSDLVNYYKVGSDGTVDLKEDYRILRHQTNPSLDTITKWQNTYQEDIQAYVTQANKLDEEAAAELMKNMPKPVPTTSNPHASPTHMGGTKVTVKSFPDPTGSLWGIAQKVYGNGNMWPYIYEANKNNPNIPANWDPNDVQEGWEIHVPSIPRDAPVPAVPAAARSGGQSA